MRELFSLVTKVNRLGSRPSSRGVVLFIVALVAVVTMADILLQTSPLAPPKSEVLPLSGPTYVPGEFLAKFKSGTSLESIREFNRILSVEELGYLAEVGVFRLKAPPGFSVAQMIQIYTSHPDIEYVELNYVAEPQRIPVP